MNYRDVWHKILHTSYPFNYSQTGKCHYIIYRIDKIDTIVLL